MAEALSGLPGVRRVLHPALPGDPGHHLWRQDFRGASGLFGIVLETRGEETMRSFFNGLKLFGMGGSWGGYESLMIPTWPERNRKVLPWRPGGQTMRIHAGLEAVDDLIEDITNGIEVWNAGE